MATRIKGYRVNKDGKVVKINIAKDAAARARERGSKKVRVVKPGTRA